MLCNENCTAIFIHEMKKKKRYEKHTGVGFSVSLASR